MIVYLITNKITGKRYVGQTVDSISKRWITHKSDHSGCRRLRNSIKKHGPENFDMKVLARCSSLEEMNHREKYYVRIFKTLVPNGYNLKDGGNNSLASAETKARMSASQKGIKKPQTVEHTEKIAAQKRGKKQSQEHKDKRAKALLRKIEVPELKMVFRSFKEAWKALGAFPNAITLVLNGSRKNWKGLTFKHTNTETSTQNSDESLLLLDNFLKTKHLIKKKDSPTTIEAKRIRQKKSVLNIETGTLYSSIKEAAKEMGLQEAGVGRVARGEMKQTGGYTFKFVGKAE